MDAIGRQGRPGGPLGAPDRFAERILHSGPSKRQTRFVRHPWNALTELLALPAASVEEDGPWSLAFAAQEAWTETASRLGLVRLGWRPIGPEADFDLAFPCERALVKAEARAGPSSRIDGSSARSPEPDAADESRVAHDAGMLVAAAPSGELPPRGTLVEIATLAAGLQARRELRQRLRRADQAAGQGRRAAAAAHDLRNELTRALLHAARAGEGDAGEVVDALAAARELAQTALESDAGLGATARPEAVPLRALVVEEARAASAAARVPEASMPRLRVRCSAEMVALAEPSALGRAMRNLITNALEAAAKGRRTPGKVEVRVERFATTEAGFDVRLRVADDGIGIEPGALSRFLDGGGAAGGGGDRDDSYGKPSSTGLGTASLRLALEALGSPFRAASTPGGGTTAEVWLRSAPDRRPVLLIDPDLRRGRRRAEWLAAHAGETAWVLARPSAAHGLATTDLVERVECVTSLGDPSARAALVRICERQRVPLVWRVGRALAPLALSR